MSAARRNGKRLLYDAITLFDLKRYPSAFARAVLAIEEAGKLTVLRQLARLETTLMSRNHGVAIAATRQKIFLDHF